MGLSGLTGFRVESEIVACVPDCAAEHCRFIPRKSRFWCSTTFLKSALSSGRWLLWTR